MLDIDNKILSFDLFEKNFVCDIESCLGECCIDGDSGAPLEDTEIDEVKKAFPIIKKYLSKKYLQIIENEGLYIVDEDGDNVTPCYQNNECAYTVFENGIAKCAFEIAYEKGEIEFKKPISCHLYPIRITEYEKFDAINYEKRKICKAGRICGTKLQIPVYQFLKEPLIRKYGEDWYAKVEIAAKELKKNNEE